MTEAEEEVMMIEAEEAMVIVEEVMMIVEEVMVIVEEVTMIVEEVTMIVEEVTMIVEEVMMIVEEVMMIEAEEALPLEVVAVVVVGLVLISRKEIVNMVQLANTHTILPLQDQKIMMLVIQNIKK